MVIATAEFREPLTIIENPSQIFRCLLKEFRDISRQPHP